MQYILDESEMEEIRKLRKDVKHLPTVEELQKMCTKIADEWPISNYWDDENSLSPWRCMITERANGHEWYCDNCPVQSICPETDKEWGQ
jgi:hypothetical protein